MSIADLMGKQTIIRSWCPHLSDESETEPASRGAACLQIVSREGRVRRSGNAAHEAERDRRDLSVGISVRATGSVA